ncbi:MAG: RluA family pseudouridine synthase [Candidatus Omnitrophica bacterium]|nr:RluA family pseudouridine synthase [Candidatus Omnitrophota bacterium]
MNIPIIYEDDWLVIVDKPSGLLVIPTPKKENRTLTSILNLHPCHRLDRETSGLIIYAKGKSVQKQMMELFFQRQVKKNYLAFVQGKLPQRNGVIKSTIEGKPAQTHYAVLEERKDFSIVKVIPVTGRKNQIRIHFKSIGHPIVGESKFAFRKDFALKAKRVCLHANYLEFLHPVTKKMLQVEAKLAADMEQFLNSHPN